MCGQSKLHFQGNQSIERIYIYFENNQDPFLVHYISSYFLLCKSSSGKTATWNAIVLTRKDTLKAHCSDLLFHIFEVK